MATLVRDRLNSLLSTSQDIALGKDSRLYFKSAAWLLLISVVSAWADLVTLGYACEFHVLHHLIPFQMPKFVRGQCRPKGVARWGDGLGPPVASDF